jgi:hypothetical protein
VTSWLQTRLASVDRGRCGWSLDRGAGALRRCQAWTWARRLLHMTIYRCAPGVGYPAKPAASPWSGPCSTAQPGGWRGFTMTADGLRLLQDLRRSCSTRHASSGERAPANLTIYRKL